MNEPAQRPVRQSRSRPDLVSVVIPVRNGARTLGAQLEALERQTYSRDWEVVLSDNGSSDETVALARKWSDRLPLRVVDSSDLVGVANARNVGVQESSGDLICVCDSDDVISDGWLEGLVAAALDADLVAGSLEVEQLNPSHTRSWRQRPAASLGTAPPYAPGGNCAIWRDVLEQVGGFKEFGYGEDLEFSKRVLGAGFQIGWAPDAVIHYRLPSDLRSLIRQNVRAGRARARLERHDHGRRFRKTMRGATSDLAWVAVRVPYLATGRRGMWLAKASSLIGYLAEVVHPAMVVPPGPAPRIMRRIQKGTGPSDSDTAVSPVVSVLYLTYNQARFIPESLPTVVGQTYSNWELILVDDGSTDGAAEVARSWLDERGIEFVDASHQENLGLCRSINKTLSVARGRYVAMIAADDWWSPEKLADQVAILEADPYAAVAYSDVFSRDADGASVRPEETLGVEALSGNVFNKMLAGGPVPPMTALLRRSSIDAVGGYDETLFFEDWDMWLKLSAQFPFLYSNYVSASYRIQPQSMSHDTARTVDMFDSSVRILKKWTGRARETDRIIANTLSLKAWRLYTYDHRRSIRYTWKAFVLFPSRVLAIRALWVTFHLSPKSLDAIGKGSRAIVSRAQLLNQTAMRLISSGHSQ